MKALEKIWTAEVLNCLNWLAYALIVRFKMAMDGVSVQKDFTVHDKEIYGFYSVFQPSGLEQPETNLGRYLIPVYVQIFRTWNSLPEIG